MTQLKAIALSLIVPAVTAVLGFAAAWYWAAKQANQKLRDRVTELERQHAIIGATVQPISAAFQAVLIKQLTHYHTPVLDGWLRKLGPPITLTEEEEKQLQIELEKRTRDMGPEITESERDAAKMLPMVIARVRAELETTATTDLIVV